MKEGDNQHRPFPGLAKCFHPPAVESPASGRGCLLQSRWAGW